MITLTPVFWVWHSSGSSLGLLLNSISLQKTAVKDGRTSAKLHLCSLITPLAYLAPDPPHRHVWIQ